MGRAFIAEEAEEGGQVRIAVDYGQSVLDERIQRLSQKLAVVADRLQLNLINQSTAESNVELANSNLNNAISIYVASIRAGQESDEAKSLVTEATASAIEQRATLQRIQFDVLGLQLDVAELTGKLNYLESFDLSRELDVWCADYSYGFLNDVATIEVPGEPATVLVAPMHREPTEADGQVIARVAQEADQSFFNVALLPGIQKWRPTYRFATIDTIDYEEDTCDLTLEPARSTARNLDINQSDTLSTVPIQYMTCNAAAFEEGDSVLVQFDEQDWLQPRVIGFKERPKACAPYRVCVIFESNGRFAVANAGIDNSGTFEYKDLTIIRDENPYPGARYLSWSKSGGVSSFRPPADGALSNIQNERIHWRLRLRFDVTWQQTSEQSTEWLPGSVEVVDGDQYPELSIIGKADWEVNFVPSSGTLQAYYADITTEDIFPRTESGDLYSGFVLDSGFYDSVSASPELGYEDEYTDIFQSIYSGIPQHVTLKTRGATVDYEFEHIGRLPDGFTLSTPSRPILPTDPPALQGKDSNGTLRPRDTPYTTDINIPTPFVVYRRSI